MKCPQATIEIPELEFEIQADMKRKTDTVYNHIASAIFNLGMMIDSQNKLPSPTAQRIGETIEELNKLLDIETPWTFVVRDPEGISDFKPRDGIEIVEGDLS
eukprot:c489_g1_i1.p4 GENE.c489_g1_i1~~c489_g1_i1.p4  ORF type:complete len:102 (+),score=35.68 c489_g1_i1:561-866(+)